MVAQLCFVILVLAAVTLAQDQQYYQQQDGQQAYHQQQERTTPQTLRFNFENDGVNGYKFDYENSDGTAHASQGLKNRVGGLAVTGSYTEVGPDGQLHTVNYIADEKGYRAFGDHIPQAQ